MNNKTTHKTIVHTTDLPDLERIGLNYQSIVTLKYYLSNNLSQESVTQHEEEITSLEMTIKGLMVMTIEGDKENFDIFKEKLLEKLNSLKKFIDTSEAIMVKRKEKNNQKTH